MKKFLLLSLLALCTLADALFSSPYIINEVNSKVSTTWQAGENLIWKDLSSTEEVKSMLGWKGTGKQLNRTKITVQDSLPTNFDSATQWSQCKTIGTIYNQARCGSCWAFGCVEAVSDRFCIHSNGTVNELLSFEDEVSCGPDDGCEGGEPGDAWEYVQQTGLVTAKCYPYNIPTCPPQQQPCLNFVTTPPCVQKCVDGETWSKSKHYTKSTYGVGPNPSEIQQEIYSNGPVEACFGVYEDFLHYKSGVYQHTTGSYLGGHCIKIIGWGEENGTPYWLVNNSWTTYWGDNGQFKILRGSDECGIESQVVAGMPSY